MATGGEVPNVEGSGGEVNAMKSAADAEVANAQGSGNGVMKKVSHLFNRN